jgi:AcrR family transcriptional regulator
VVRQVALPAGFDSARKISHKTETGNFVRRSLGKVGQPIQLVDEAAGTRRQILEGALRAIGELGVANLSMQGIANAAGVSRGTIYRYYRNLDDVLLAVANFDQRRYNTGAQKAVNNAPKGIEQLRVLLEYSFNYFDNHPARWMIDNEPILMLDYHAANLPRMARALDRLLHDVLSETSITRSGKSSSTELADLIVRTLVSAYFFPGDDPQAPLNTVMNLVADCIEA